MLILVHKSHQDHIGVLINPDAIAKVEPIVGDDTQAEIFFIGGGSVRVREALAEINNMLWAHMQAIASAESQEHNNVMKGV